MKKILILLLILIIPTACINVNEAYIGDLIAAIHKGGIRSPNQIRTGYRYFLPNHLTVLEIKGLNEVIKSRDFTFFMYVDLVSYHNKIEFNYEINESALDSRIISHEGVDGYLEINVKDNDYLIEIVYNYAKIEVVVDAASINEAVATALIILSSIRFNDNIIKNMLDGNILNFGEETLKIFETNPGDSKFLDYDQEYGVYEGEDAIPDIDLIN